MSCVFGKQSHSGLTRELTLRAKAQFTNLIPWSDLLFLHVQGK